MRWTLFGLAIAFSLGVSVSVAAAQVPQDAWDVLLRHDPDAAAGPSILALEKKILRSLSPQQASEFARGADPSTIVLGDGRTLEDLLNGAGFDLSWYTIAGGGGILEGGSYRLDGTVGQAYAGEMSGGAFTLTGGFQAVVQEGEIFRDGFESGDVDTWSSVIGFP